MPFPEEKLIVLAACCSNMALQKIITEALIEA